VRVLQVASRLWQLVVVESGLMDYLGALKDYMLLAKGDFYQGLLTDAARTLALPPNKVADKDLGEGHSCAAYLAVPCSPSVSNVGLLFQPRHAVHSCARTPS